MMKIRPNYDSYHRSDKANIAMIPRWNILSLTLYRLIYSEWATLSPPATYLVLCHYERFFTLSAAPMIAAAHTTSAARITPKILHTRLYNIIISVGDVLDILFSSSLRCLFLYICSRSWHLICTTLQHGICHSISDFDRNTSEIRCACVPS